MNRHLKKLNTQIWANLKHRNENKPRNKNNQVNNKQGEPFKIQIKRTIECETYTKAKRTQLDNTSKTTQNNKYRQLHTYNN